jgi:hypothetical protein
MEDTFDSLEESANDILNSVLGELEVTYDYSNLTDDSNATSSDSSIEQNLIGSASAQTDYDKLNLANLASKTHVMKEDKSPKKMLSNINNRFKQ